MVLKTSLAELLLLVPIGLEIVLRPLPLVPDHLWVLRVLVMHRLLLSPMILLLQILLIGLAGIPASSTICPLLIHN